VVLQTKTKITLLPFCLLILLTVCGKKEGKLPMVSPDEEHRERWLVTHTENVSSLISDSGVTRYRLNAKVWNTYQPEKQESYWHFPEKFHLENFDSLFNVVATVDADTAFYYEKREIWRLAKNVRIRNLDGVLFETEELYWDQRARPEAPDAIQTAKPVRVVLPNGDEQHHAGGFKSDRYMQLPRFYNTKETITFIEKTGTNSRQQDDSLQERQKSD
jgi:hypothetical protein